MSGDFEFEQWFEGEFLEEQDQGYSVQEGWGSNEMGGFERVPDPNRKKTYQLDHGSSRTLTIRYKEDVVGYAPSTIQDEGNFETGYVDYSDFEAAVGRLGREEDAKSSVRTAIFEFEYVMGDNWERFVDKLADAVSELDTTPTIRLAGASDEKLAFCYAEQSPTAN